MSETKEKQRLLFLEDNLHVVVNMTQSRELDAVFMESGNKTHLPLEMCMTPANADWIIAAVQVGIHKLNEELAKDEDGYTIEELYYAPFVLGLSFTREYLSCPARLPLAIKERLRMLRETNEPVFYAIGYANILTGEVFKNGGDLDDADELMSRVKHRILKHSAWGEDKQL